MCIGENLRKLPRGCSVRTHGCSANTARAASIPTIQQSGCCEASVGHHNACLLCALLVSSRGRPSHWHLAGMPPAHPCRG